jgi:DNA transformation protein and related proteins
MAAAKDQDFLDFVRDQLSRLPRVSAKRMFGAIGLYQDACFFGIIDEGRLYFLTGDESRKRYVQQGMKPFEFAAGQRSRSYYEVPVDVLEDDRELCDWAREAVTAQETRRRKRPARAKSKAKKPSSRR